MANDKHEKRLLNRYDPYEVCHFFTDSAEEYLSAHLQKSWRRFAFKALLGVLLFINGYLSHWGPWPWPNNYYLIAFSVVFYHVASYLYGRLTGISNADGHHVKYEITQVGDYKFEKEAKGVIVKIGEDKQKYTLEVVDSGKEGCLEVTYTDYFTKEGYFLEQKYHKLLEDFLERVNKMQKKE